ncbi:MAG: helix-turn-helix domain-containing protein [Proteobacteria bacterium]|nr:helix-turn-helix domain-containing protein [Pseudomonadota bacterium]
MRELERRGVLPGHRLGGSLRFSRVEIDALLLKSRQPTLDEIAEGARVDIVPVDGLGPLLDPENASSYLGLPSVDALNHRVRRGEVPTYRVGRQLRFREAELDAAVTSRRRAVACNRAFSPSQTLTHDRALLIDEGDARLPR